MTVISRTISPCGPTKTDCRCPECGGLECLCRPRFFAGQLLTEEDLNRLDYYVRARFRMHNLSLHGTGVVNGLKVLCDPCGAVKVTVGHAISPCGDDIIVCEDAAVPICDLIRKCKMAERKYDDCDPPRRIPNTSCEDLEEEWVLAIKYDEKPTRGVVPLRTAICSSCGCGSSTCACGDSCDCDACCEPPLRTNRPKPRTAPETCEPTVICQGFRFCVHRKPEPVPDDPQNDRRIQFFDDESDLIRQLQCCFELLIAAIPVMPDPGQSNTVTSAQLQALVTFCCRLRQNLLDYFMRHPHTNCEVIGILNQLRCPDPSNLDGFAMAYVQAILTLLAIWLDAIKQCFCLALLPPAPQPTCEDRIPLATVRVTAKDCKVLSVCNWTTERKMLISWPSVTYWLGSLSIWGLLREAMDNLCCSSLVGIFDDILQDDTVGTVTAAPGTAPVNTIGGLSARLDTAFAGIGPRIGLAPNLMNLSAFTSEFVSNWNEPAGLSRVLNAASPRFRFPEAGRPLGTAERANLPELITMELIGKPVLASFLGIVGEVDTGTPSKDVSDTARKTDDTVEELRVEMERQKVDIALLKQALADRGE